MKRSVVVLGSTSMFLRWAIAHPCSLRDLHGRDIPDGTFRQLRGVQEISIADSERRIVDGMCLHPEAHLRDLDAALGFSVSEVTAAFGGWRRVEECCRQCPANLGSTERASFPASCFGCLSVDLSIQIDRLIRGELMASESNLASASVIPSDRSLIREVERAIDQLSLAADLEAHFSTTIPRWYGLWQTVPLNLQQLGLLEGLFGHVHDSLAKRRDPPAGIIDVARFLKAIKRCREYRIDLHVIAVPTGFSDGRHWTLHRHCQFCRFTDDEIVVTNQPRTLKCRACGRNGQVGNQVRHKVLGIRPYRHLVSMIGRQQALELLQTATNQSSI